VHMKTHFFLLREELHGKPPSIFLNLCRQNGRKYKLIIIYCNNRFQYTAVTSINERYGNDTLTLDTIEYIQLIAVNR
jgi:hypothetical protein